MKCAAKDCEQHPITDPDDDWPLCARHLAEMQGLMAEPQEDEGSTQDKET